MNSCTTASTILGLLSVSQPKKYKSSKKQTLNWHNILIGKEYTAQDQLLHPIMNSMEVQGYLSWPMNIITNIASPGLWQPTCTMSCRISDGNSLLPQENQEKKRSSQSLGPYPMAEINVLSHKAGRQRARGQSVSTVKNKTEQDWLSSHHCQQKLKHRLIKPPPCKETKMIHALGPDSMKHSSCQQHRSANTVEAQKTCAQEGRCF